MSRPASVDDLSLVQRLQPIGALSDDSLRELLRLAHTITLPRGGTPFCLAEGDGRLLYLLRGELLVSSPGGAKEVIVGGSGRALSPLSYQRQRPILARAITDAELIGFAEDPLDVLVTWDQLADPGAAGDVEGNPVTDWRQMPGLFAARNLTQGAFSTLPAANIAPLLDKFERIPVHRGDTILRQGEEGDYYYVIERGRCKVTRVVAGVPVELAELTEGDVFGEEALVADAQRNATVVMKTDGVLFRLAKRDFITLLRQPLLQRLAPAEARQKMNDPAVIWIDVRFPAEFRQDGLPGAINIPLNELRAAVATFDPGKVYILYCQTGRRSSAAAFLLCQRGLRAFLLDGGMKAMANAEQTLEKLA